MSPQAQVLARWKADPVRFVVDNFHVEPDWWQADMLRAYNRPDVKRVAGVACKGPGKTTVMSWAGWHFMATRPHCKVPCASINGSNLKDGLWAEFRKWQMRSPILMAAFEWTQTRIFEKKNPGTWFASFRTWAQDADPQQQANTIAGLHEDYLLWLLDEASEMPDGVVSAALAALMGGIETKAMIAGNCTRTSGPIWRASGQDRHLWHVTRITGDPDDPRRSPRIDIEEARRQIAEHGRDSYTVKVNILAEFPDRQADKLLDIRDCEVAMDRGVAEGAHINEARILGVDTARFGDDKSIIAPRQGRVCFKLKEFDQLDTVVMADQIIRVSDRWQADKVFIDEGGIGGGTVDQCRSRGYRVQGINFGSKATDEKKFVNKRAEMYFKAAEWVTKGGGNLPEDRMLATELSAPIYWHDKLDRICIEPKDDIKARLGRSPDRADAFVLSFAHPVIGKRAREKRDIQAITRKRADGRSRNDYDPLGGR